MMLIWMWLACADPPIAEDIPFGEGSVGEALTRLEAAAQQPREQPTDPRVEEIETKLGIIEDRILQLEVAVTDLQTHGVIPATHIGYDPRSTTLDSENVQSALDELETRLADVESRVGQDMGRAGPGLFEIPEDNNQNRNNPGQPGPRTNQGRGQGQGQGQQGQNR
jgi:hypothetical protein